MSSVDSLPSPIYRLDASSWAFIGSFLGPGDVTRLCSANHRLSILVRAVIRDLNLVWHSHRFIELGLVLSHSSSFSRLNRLVFRQHKSTVRSWTAEWSLLPRNLTSLTLSFLDAPSLILASGSLESLVPDLHHLDLEDLQFSGDTNVYSNVSFKGLPSNLTHLRVHSRRPLAFKVDDLSSLPSCLEDLELSFSPRFGLFTDLPGKSVSEASFSPPSSITCLTNDSFRATLPKLPESLMRLRILDGWGDFWFVRCTDLPSSLETFHFESLNWMANVLSEGVGASGEAARAQQMSDSFSIIDIAGAAFHWPRMKRFIASDLQITFSEALAHIPASATAVEALIIGSDDEVDEQLLDDLMTRVVSRFQTLRSFSSDMMAYATTTGKYALPNLKTWHARSLPIDDAFIIPKSVTSLEPPSWIPLKSYDLPPSIEVLNLLELFEFPLVSLDFPKLHTLELPQQFDMRTYAEKEIWYDSLPNTLTRLSMSASISNWSHFLQFMALPSKTGSGETKLPNLVDIRNRTMISPVCLGLTPPQVRTLRCNLWQESGAIFAVPDAFMDSCLEKLSVTGTNTQGPESSEAMSVAFMSRLPRKLKSLKFVFPCNPLNLPQIQLPDSLTSLQIQGDWSEEPTNVTCLPASLTRLVVQRYEYTIVPAKVIPLECLPPYLSRYDPQDLEAQTQYINSRVPPTSGLVLTSTPYIAKVL